MSADFIPSSFADLDGELPAAALPASFVEPITYDFTGQIEGRVLYVTPGQISTTYVPVPWSQGIKTFPITADHDHYVVSEGFNCGDDGQPIDPTRNMVRNGYEWAWPIGDAGEHQSEWHWSEFTWAAGQGGVAAATARPFSTTVIHERRIVNNTMMATSFGILDAAIVGKQHYAISYDSAGDILSATWYGGNVNGFSIALGPTGDGVSMGRAASSSTLVGIQGRSVQLSLTNDTTNSSLRMLAGTSNLEIIAGGVLGVTINCATRAVTLAGALSCGSLIVPSLADASIPNGGLAWSLTDVGQLKARTPAGALKVVTIA